MKALLTVLVVLALVGAFLYYSFPEIFHPFNREAVERDFIASIPTIFRTPGGNLEVAGFTATETFVSSDTAKVPFFNWNIPGATTTVIIKAPVIYRYHVRVLDRWEIEVVNNTCRIYAPELRPTLPPAIETDKMEISSFEGPLAFNAEVQQAKLLQSLTPQLNANATDTTKLKLVREEARKTVSEFVQAWLLQRGDWGEKKIENIKVVFREELPKADELNLFSDSLRQSPVDFKQ
ncbi:MAG: hypothetical protein ONB42_11455 [candidate division KSB1 bacterium]|nr:hypothetical protein [candidate division KSB1 bacterium]MDZ7312109.1 hypothetical protein [candidate division KSB1 bacterium]